MQKHCISTYHIETAEELPLDIIKGVETLGITAGASTPDWIIKEVIDKMTEMDNMKQQPEEMNNTQEEPVNGETVAENKEEPVTEETAVQNGGAVPQEEDVVMETEEAQEADTETMEGIEDTIITVRPGKVVKGQVIQVGENEVIVNIGYKADGVIPKDELSNDPTLEPSDVVKVGDEIEVFVKKIDEKEGSVLLSKKKVDIEKAWKTLKEKHETGEPVNAKCWRK